MKEMIPTQPYQKQPLQYPTLKAKLCLLSPIPFTILTLNSAKSPLFSTFASTVANMVTGDQSSPFRYDNPAQREASRAESSKSAHDQCLSLCSNSFLYIQTEFVLDQIKYFDET